MSPPNVVKSISRLPQDDSISWYHGKVTREEAELILRNEGLEEGLFLVRDSTSSQGDFVLSVVSGGKPVHYQIRRNGDDAYYSIDDSPIIHGLEMLILYYQEGGEGLSTTLGRMCKGGPPPHESRRHGRTNLLHRATQEGNMEIVGELVRSGYHSLDAKNQEGRTAVHIAAMVGDDAVLTELLKAGANANIRDSTGRAPLHYACQQNFPNTVKLLLEEGGANFQLRASDNCWVPLHEASSRGFVDIVKVLLSHGAPCKPRSSDTNATPYDLALQNNHIECAQLLARFPGAPLVTSPDQWFHGNLSRQQAHKLLEEAKEDGSFLVRKSCNKPDVYVLSLYFATRHYNYEILQKGRYMFIDDGPYLESLAHLIQHYSRFSDGLPINLVHPVKPVKSSELDKIPYFSANICYEQSHLMPSENQTTETQMFPHLICRESLKLGHIIGEGEFGAVLKGLWANPLNNISVEVAVKSMRDDAIRHSFIKEVEMMTSLDHPCIVKLLGVCLGPPLMMVQELVPMGSLLDFLLEHPQEVTLDPDLYLWSAQIAWGMLYLERKRCVHRDLAARNILLASKSQVKISDFGLSRRVGDSDIYKAKTGGRWPVKWYAPESINYGNFSHLSDVWSYGITLWEMFSLGQQPYGEMTGTQVLEFLKTNQRLKQPDSCPDHMYQVMLSCWQYRPSLRPTFTQLVTLFLQGELFQSIQPLLRPLAAQIHDLPPAVPPR